MTGAHLGELPQTPNPDRQLTAIVGSPREGERESVGRQEGERKERGEMEEEAEGQMEGGERLQHVVLRLLTWA